MSLIVHYCPAPLDISLERARYKPGHASSLLPFPHTGYCVYTLYVSLISVLKDLSNLSPTVVEFLSSSSVLRMYVCDGSLMLVAIIEHLTRSHFMDEGLLLAYSSMGHNTSCMVGGLAARMKGSGSHCIYSQEAESVNIKWDCFVKPQGSSLVNHYFQ